jgi:hypothetical protein
MKKIIIILAAIWVTALGATIAKAQSSTSERPDSFGNTKTTFRDSNGKVIGHASSRKNHFGHIETTYYSKRKPVAKSRTERPDSFGNRLTRFFKIKKRK